MNFSNFSKINFLYEIFQILNDQDVLVRYWSKDPISEWLRISIGTDAEIDRLLEVIDAAVTGTR